MKDFDNIIAEVLDYAERDGNTLVVVSADHETGGLTMPSAGGGKLRHEFSTGGHTAQHVPVFSFGPQSERFAGRYDNTDIAKKIFSIWAMKWNSRSASFLFVPELNNNPGRPLKWAPGFFLAVAEYGRF